jgi:hypothetical protein
MVDAKAQKEDINRRGESTDTPSYTHSQLMSGYKNFAIVGAGALGNYLVQQFLKDKAAGLVKDVVVLTRQVKCPLDT